MEWNGRMRRIGKEEWEPSSSGEKNKELKNVPTFGDPCVGWCKTDNFDFQQVQMMKLFRVEPSKGLLWVLTLLYC